MVRYAAGLQPAANGVYAWMTPDGGWGESNAALISGHRTSLLVDTLWDLPRTRAMLEGFGPYTEASPIHRLVNTHSDGDHWFGNELVGAKEIIATAAAAYHMEGHGPGELAKLGAVGRFYQKLARFPLPRRREYRAASSYFQQMIGQFDFSGITPTVPTNTFTGELTLDVGGRPVQLIEVGPAHSPGDLVVLIPDTRTLVAGDVLFIGVTPVLWEGLADNWIAACQRIMTMEVDVIVPGHGPLTDRAGAEMVRNYWHLVRTIAHRQWEKGRNILDAAWRIIGSETFNSQPFGHWEGQERLYISIASMYRVWDEKKGPMSINERLGVLRKTAALADELKAG